MDLKNYFFPFGVKPKPEPDDGPRYADLYERAAAAAIDVTLLFLLLYNLFTMLTRRIYGLADMTQVAKASVAPTGWEAFQLSWQAGLGKLWLLNSLLQILIMGVFVLTCQFGWRTTPGKYLMGLSIRRVGTLEEPAYWRYVLRYLSYLVGGPLFFVISFNKRHRGVHDYIAGTVVIHTRPRGWYWEQTKRGLRWIKSKFNSGD